jgi:uncharacterized repeat protein (TIGR01451 family)
MSKKISKPEQPLKRWIISAGIIFLLWQTTLLAMAQTTDSRPPLALAKVVTAEPVVAGDTLTYLITLTNTGQVSLAGIIVTDSTPEGTTIFGASGPSGWWVQMSAEQGKSGDVTWRSEQALAAGESVMLRFDVAVAPDVSGQIVSDNYQSRVEGWAEAVTGPPLITNVITPPPTWTPPPTATTVSTPTPASTPTTLAEKTATATATSPPAITPEQNPSPTQISSAPVENSSPEQPDNRGIVIWLGIVFLLLFVLVIIFFIVKQRTSN